MNSINVYDPWGKLIGKQNPTKWSEIAPESIAEAFYLRLCKTDKNNLEEEYEFGSLRVILQQANIRELPSMNGSIVEKAKKGRVFRLVSGNSKDGWYQIYISKDKTAWIHGNMVEFVRP